jgi:hypothetical protein
LVVWALVVAVLLAGGGLWRWLGEPVDVAFVGRWGSGVGGAI